MSAHEITLTVNGEEVREAVDARTTLVDFLRDTLGLTGSHVGCEHGVCGTCSVRLDGVVVRGCLTLAVQCDGHKVETIEGASDSGALADLQETFRTRNALQCRVARRSASISRATTAAAPAITPSSMPSKRWRAPAREQRHE